MFEQIKKVIVESLNIEESLIVPGAKLQEDLAVDSLSSAELVLELETEFDVRIEDEEMFDLKTVQDIVDLIASKK